MISRDEIDRIIEATDIVSLVSEFVTLEKAGKNYRGLCPFHNENTPSFSVNPEKKIAKCMGCGKGGTPITFLMEIKNISFVEATLELANKVGIKLDISVPNKKQDNNAKYYKIMDIAQNFYSHNLLATKSGEFAIQYLHKRGIDDETIKMFDIGLAPNKPDVLFNVLKDADVLELDMLDLGLVNRHTNGFYDLFTKRIIFPISDELGNVVGFSGRIYQAEDVNQPKYINSPETIIFKKGHILYNLNKAISEIRKKNRVIIYEGFMDVIASCRSGNKEAVCSMGTALTLEQARLLKKYTSHVIICYDGDKAGIKASLKAIDIFTEVGMMIHLVLLPDGLDPDDYSKKYGKEAFLEYFDKNLIDPIEYQYLNALKNRNFKDYSQVEETKSLVFSSISKTNSQTLIETYLKRLSDDLNVSFASLVIDYNSYSNKTQVLKPVENSYVNKKNYNSFEQEMNMLLKQQLCSIRIMNYAKESKEKARYIDSRIELNSMEDRHQKLWMKLIDSFYEAYDEYNMALYLDLLSSEQKNWLFNDNQSLEKLPNIPYNDDDLEECIATLNVRHIEKQIEFLTNKINKASFDEQTSLIVEKIELLKIRDSKTTKTKRK